MSIYKLKKIALVGVCGKTGTWYARLLLERGHRVIGLDSKGKEHLAYDLLNHEQFCFSEDEKIINQIEGITLSPGVPLELSIFKNARKIGLPVFSEFQYCFGLLKDRIWIGITGTDGKSTTVDMAVYLFKKMGQDAIGAGNLGTPFSQLLFEKKSAHIIVAELSSYQLELSYGFRPDVAVYLNLAADHLDRYSSLEHYGSVKWKIIDGADKNTSLIYNSELEKNQTKKTLQLFYQKNQIKKIAVNLSLLKSKHFWWEKQKIFAKTAWENPIIVDTQFFKVRHNRSNALFVLEIFQALNLLTPQLPHLFQEYSGLPHRFELLPSSKKDSNIYINDSKATTTNAVLTALSNVSLPLFLFMGGKTKGEKYITLHSALQNLGEPIWLFLFGEGRKVLQEEINWSNTFVFQNLREAIEAARELQKDLSLKGVTWLLSPGATSWDQFNSFEERGDLFRSLVLTE